MSQIDQQGVIKSELKMEGDVLIHKTTQPTEDLILERNKELRKNPGAIRDLGEQSGESFGRLVASIPIIMFNKAIKDGYKLNSPDGDIAQKEMFRFLQSTEGKMCLVRDNAVTPNKNKNKYSSIII